MTARMRPLAEFPLADRRRVRAILTDIDDTLTDHGRLPAVAYAALERLRAAGLIVVPVTGRPGGWCDLIARQWPVDAVVGENGAFWFRYDERSQRMERRYARDAATRAADRMKLQAIEAEVLARVPGAAVAADQAYREADLAIDVCEDVPALDEPAIARILEIFARHGAVAKLSSIHVNGWFGTYDKLSTSRDLVRNQFGIDLDRERSAVVFVGDSPNDAPMFGHFPNAVGVANVRRFEERLAAAPAWVTPSPGAAGFVELTDALLAAR